MLFLLVGTAVLLSSAQSLGYKVWPESTSASEKTVSLLLLASSTGVQANSLFQLKASHSKILRVVCELWII